MLTWRCPHCATVQAEASRCFLCGRPAVSCASCAMFRRSLVGGVGYCAMDKRREPLSGAEQRGCWVGSALTASDGLFVSPPDAPPPPSRGLIELG